MSKKEEKTLTEKLLDGVKKTGDAAKKTKTNAIEMSPGVAQKVSLVVMGVSLVACAVALYKGDTAVIAGMGALGYLALDSYSSAEKVLQDKASGKKSESKKKDK